MQIQTSCRCDGFIIADEYGKIKISSYEPTYTWHIYKSVIFDGYNMGPDIAIGDEIISTYQ